MKKSSVICTLIAAELLLSCSACTLSPENAETPSPSINENESVVFEYTETEYNGYEFIIIEGYEPPVKKYIFDRSVPDFLTEEQQNLYHRAYAAYSTLQGNLHTILDYPPENTAAISDTLPDTPIFIDSARYILAEGRYVYWEDFKSMCLSVFTEEYFQEISTYFTEIDGYVYYPDADKGSDLGYKPDLAEDTFELVSQSDTEIKFNLIAHYFNTLSPSEDDVPEAVYYPIEMVLTDDGWRFSKFHVASWR